MLTAADIRTASHAFCCGFLKPTGRIPLLLPADGQYKIPFRVAVRQQLSLDVNLERFSLPAESA
jgi:hypothetical protein